MSHRAVTTLDQRERLRPLLSSFCLYLQASSRTASTVRTYRTSVRLWLDTYDGSESLTAALRGYIAARIGYLSPATVRVYWQSLNAFFAWLESEGEIESNPMKGIPRPRVPVNPPPVLSDEQVRRLLVGLSKRDTVILRLLAECGLRRSEVGTLARTDVDVHSRIILVTGKGRKKRIVPISAKTAVAIDRLLRSRTQEEERLIGITPDRITHLVRDIGRRHGIKLHPHMLRHYSAHTFLSRGGNEHEAMALYGWTSLTMLGRYAASTASERMRVTFDRLRMGDNL